MKKLAFLIFVALTVPAAAHPGHAAPDILHGFLHPFSGIDHVSAMLAVGAWSALLGGRRIWAWPLIFVAAMLAGAGLAQTGWQVPMVEQGIAASLVVVGLLLALAIDIPVVVGGALVAAFALFHGFAHGSEAGGSGVVAFMLGFTTATVALHIIGIGMARSLIAAFSSLPVRMIGAATAVAGVALLASGSLS